MQAPMLRPLGVGEILDAAFKIYTRQFATLLKIVAVVVVPIQALSAVILLSTVDDPDAINGTGNVDSDDTWGLVAGTLVGSLLGWVALAIATGAVVKAVADGYLAREPSWRESLAYAGGRWRSLVWLSLLSTFLLILAFIALIVPGIWLAIAWMVAVPALMIEGCRGTKALGRSFRLVRNRWWATFGVIVIAYLLAGAIQFAAGAIFGAAIVAGLEDSLVGTVLMNTLATTLASVLATPFQAAVTTIVYFDLRVRKEGFDLQLLAERIGGAAPDHAPYAGAYAHPGWGQQQPGQPPQQPAQPVQPAAQPGHPPPQPRQPAAPPASGEEWQHPERPAPPPDGA
jgi:hypothetical protein